MTGYTKAAGRSFVGAAEQNGVTLIAVSYNTVKIDEADKTYVEAYLARQIVGVLLLWKVLRNFRLSFLFFRGAFVPLPAAFDGSGGELASAANWSLPAVSRIEI